MRKLLPLLAVAIFASCSQVPEDKVNATAEANTISVDIPQTRTALGGKNEDDCYSVRWSAEDKLVANGTPSTGITIGNDGSSAKFTYNVINAPFKLTYPYTEGSLCSEDRPTVVFTAEQNYVEGTFGVGYAPMCGYNTSFGTTVLKHLAGVLHISLTGSTTLSKIEVVAADGVALAGEFDVDCQTGNITPIEGKTLNKVTYVANQELSEVAKSFFVVVPMGDFGTCKVILTNNQGSHMDLTWNGKDVKGGVVREFKPFAFRVGVSFELGGLPAEDDEFNVPELVIQNSNEIWYTSSDGQIVTPNATDAFGANIESNTYEEGKGVITFDAPISSIGDSAFNNCQTLTSIEIPKGVTSIGKDAFRACSNLTSVTIPYGVISIRNTAFGACTGLTSVTIPNSVTSVGGHIFGNCSSLTAFYGKFASADNRCLVVNGVLNSFAPAGLTEYTVPDNVTSIGGWSFAYCNGLRSVTIPNSVASIGDRAFRACSGLTSIIIPESVTEIGAEVLWECSSLKEVYCKPTTPPTIGVSVFDDADSALVIYVPVSSDSSIINAYKSATNWSNYQNRIKEDADSFAIEGMTGETEQEQLEF